MGSLALGIASTLLCHLVLVVGEQDGRSVELAEWILWIDGDGSVQSL